MKKLITLIVTFFGVGYIKPAPGTWGTLATIPLWWLLVKGTGPLFYMIFLTLFIMFAIIACSLYEKYESGHDHSHIVIDEVVGFLITLLWLPATWQTVLIGFVLFRILDISKPFPIGYLDKKVQGGLGVVIDDVVAGALANIVLQIIYTQTSWLGGQFVQVH